MPGYLVHQGATVMCKHAPGQATPTVPNPRVKVGGQPIVTMATAYVIAGCALSGSAPPCATATWILGATRVRAGGTPVILKDSRSVCAPTGTPLDVLLTQVRVKGQ